MGIKTRYLTRYERQGKDGGIRQEMSFGLGSEPAYFGNGRIEPDTTYIDRRTVALGRTRNGYEQEDNKQPGPCAPAGIKTPAGIIGRRAAPLYIISYDWLQ